MGVSRSRRRLGVSLIVLAAAMGVAHAQRFPEVAPRTETPAPAPAPILPEPPKVPADQRQIIPALKGIRFVGALDQIQSRGVATAGVDTDNLPYLDDPAFLADMQARLGKPLTFAGLGQITAAAIAQYRLNHHPLVDVVTPQQDVSGGIVQLAVIEFRVGAVKPEGNQWFSDSLLRRELDLPPGSRIDDRVVDRRIAELNDNAFRRVELLYQRGAQPGDTDVLLQTEDRLPLRVYGGFQNNGTRQLGLNRLFTGFNWGNAFWQDHQFNYQYTTSDDAIFGNPSLPGRPDDPRFVAHSASYIVPLPWHDRLTLYGFYARSVPRLPSTFTQTGVSDQASFRYSIPLVVSAAQSHEVRFGYDFKQSNNNLEFGGAQVSQGSADIHQLAFEYTGRIADPWGSTSLTGCSSSALAASRTKIRMPPFSRAAPGAPAPPQTTSTARSAPKG
jgi:hemolysin activation/secretion protein